MFGTTEYYQEEIQELKHKNQELQQQINLLEFLKDEYYYALYAIRVNVDMNFTGRINRIREHLDRLKITERG